MAAMRKRSKGGGGRETEASRTLKSKSSSSKTRKRLRNWARSLGVHQSTLHAALVLLVAILTAVLWNILDTVDPSVRSFLRQICHETYCNDVLRSTHRTQKVIRDVPKGQRLVEIPRHFQIWDLDALRDEFVQKELFHARILETNPLDADAFLAAYIALLQHNKTTLSLVLRNYLDILPMYEDFTQFHPLLMGRNNLTSLLGTHTYSAQLILHRQRTIQLEYEALSNASRTFASKCAWRDFVTARLAVMTRSFGTGRLHENERDNSGRFGSLEEEMSLYRRRAGVDLSSGSFAMVPILDLYNHHAQPTVGYSYDPIKQAFVIRSLGLTAGHELWDSYGKHSDPHLYSKFGFINGDGSEATQASVATFHSLFVLPNETSNEELLRYLSFDDGYHECVTSKDGPSWELKQFKYRHLQGMAHDQRFWTVVAKPRNAHVRPTPRSAISSDWPRRNVSLALDPKHAELDLKGLMGLCRLLAVTHEDYDGLAVQLLTDNLDHAGSYILPQPSQHDAIEYRTLRCIERLVSQTLARFTNSIKDVEASIAATSNKLLKQDSRTEWTAAHLELGELQNLNLVRGMTSATLRHSWPNQGSREGEAYSIRQKPCHPEILQPLLMEH